MYTSVRLDKALSDIVKAHNKQEEAMAELEDRGTGIIASYFESHDEKTVFYSKFNL